MDGAAFGPPAVGADPQEMADVVGPLGGVEDPPAKLAECAPSNISYTAMSSLIM